MKIYIMILAILAVNISYAKNTAINDNFIYSGILRFNEAPVSGKYDFYVELFEDELNDDFLTSLSFSQEKLLMEALL